MQCLHLLPKEKHVWLNYLHNNQQRRTGKIEMKEKIRMPNEVQHKTVGVYFCFPRIKQNEEWKWERKTIKLSLKMLIIQGSG